MNGSTCSASIWGLLGKNQFFLFLILRSFRGCRSQVISVLTFFYIVDFHSALKSQVSVRQSEGRVKIYDVKNVKTGMTCALKLLDSFKVTPKYLKSRLSHSFSPKPWNTLLSINIIPWYLGWQTGAQLLPSNKWTDQARTPVLTWSWVSVVTEPDIKPHSWTENRNKLARQRRENSDTVCDRTRY